MKWIKILFKTLHICSFEKPIVSMYVSFNTRYIVYECKCGKRKVERVYTYFNMPFPIKTTNFITQKELEKQHQ
jgi:hypothetical protein